MRAGGLMGLGAALAACTSNTPAPTNTSAPAANPPAAASPSAAAGAGTRGNGNDAARLFFNPIQPSSKDDLVLADGFKYTVIRSWGDPVNATGQFGFNNDFIAYFPIDMLQGGKNSSDGLLWVNHEYPDPKFISNYLDPKVPKTKQQIEAEKKSVGGSILRVKQTSGAWAFVDDPQYNRRIDANTPIELTGPARGSAAVGGATTVTGTVANCAGGQTPWGTALSCEENYQDYSPDPDKNGYGWKQAGDPFVDEHYGWVVEVDPFDQNSVPRKHTALGRFRHEGAEVVISKATNKVVVYMGDDKVDECVYKFVSKGAYNLSDRAANLKLLEEGTLYVADFANGKWLPLDWEKDQKLQDKYKDQAEVLVKCQEAAKLIGGTRTDRPEDIAINPQDGTVYIAFTNNTDHGNFHGHILRLTESGFNPEATDFSWETFVQGGPQSGISSPDNLVFDRAGNLWVVLDISSSRLNKGIYAPFKNNGLFVIPTVGPYRGQVFQFGSGPVECEMTGTWFTPDEKTLFVAVQHPGEESKDPRKPSSTWPKGGNNMPLPSIVAITGFK